MLKTRTYFNRSGILPLLILALFLVPTTTLAAVRSVTGVVTKVPDGDTIQVQTPEQTRLKVRLYGIDAPEIEHRNRRTGHIEKPGQPFSKEARSYLSSLIRGRYVRLEIVDIDPHRRIVCLVWLNGRNINLEMIKTGMAEAYPEYLEDHRYRRQFLETERDVRERRIGIWAQGKSYERPRDFKKRVGTGGDWSYHN